MSELRDRPRPASTGWILIVTTVALVIFMGLAVWYSRFPARFLLSNPSDYELVHELTGQWRAEWPQIPGPPETYRERADAALAVGDLRTAGEWTAKALSLEPDHTPDLARVIGLVAMGHAIITTEQALALRDVLMEVGEGDEALPTAAAWAGLIADDSGVGAGLGLTGAETLDGRLAHLLSMQRANEDPLPAALRVLALAPGQPLACPAAARSLMLAKRPAEALTVIAGCEAAGAVDAMDRIAGDALDDIGRFEEAVARYDAAGATTHAAIIRIQEGLPGEVFFEPGLPDTALHQLWWGLLTDDTGRIREGQAGVAATGISGPEFDMAMAAAALHDGRPEVALDLVASLTSTEAAALQARAHQQLGDEAAAIGVIQQAAGDQPHNVRLRLAAAVMSGEGIADVLSTHPVEVALYADVRRRDAPWPALLPDTELIAGLDEAQTAQARHVLGLDVPDGDPLWRFSGEAPTTELAAEVVSLQESGLSDAVPALKALAVQHPEAAGLQELLLRLQAPNANR